MFWSTSIQPRSKIFLNISKPRANYSDFNTWQVQVCMILKRYAEAKDWERYLPRSEIQSAGVSERLSWGQDTISRELVFIRTLDVVRENMRAVNFGWPRCCFRWLLNITYRQCYYFPRGSPGLGARVRVLLTFELMWGWCCVIFNPLGCKSILRQVLSKSNKQ